jgi:hypothetical protein
MIMASVDLVCNAQSKIGIGKIKICSFLFIPTTLNFQFRRASLVAF